MMTSAERTTATTEVAITFLAGFAETIQASGGTMTPACEPFLVHYVAIMSSLGHCEGVDTALRANARACAATSAPQWLCEALAASIRTTMANIPAA